MLKRKKTTRKSSSNSNSKNSNAPSITYITDSTEIKADMFCKDDVRIAGTVNGEVQSQNKIMLTETGKVDGTVQSPQADISGKVTGDVKAKERLILRASAVIDGQISTKKLTIENGAQVKGHFNVGPDVKFDSKSTNNLKNSAS